MKNNKKIKKSLISLEEKVGGKCYKKVEREIMGLINLLF